jgi:hypothetical protein
MKIDNDYNGHMPKLGLSRRAVITIIVSAFAVLAVIVAGAAYFSVQISASNAAGNKVMVSGSPNQKPEKVITIPPPASVPSAEIVAQQLHCTNFKNIAVGDGVQGIVLDEGSCYIGSVKYAIDTFQTQASRDLWLNMATPYGVTPKWETAHSVTYKSVDS